MPTADATKTICAPPGWLSELSAVTKVPESAIATLTLTSQPADLFLPILEYAYLCQYPASHPLCHPAVRQYPHAYRHPVDPYEPVDLDPVDDDDDSLGGLFRMRKTSRVRMTTSSRSKRPEIARVPKYKFGLGTAAVVWPPPPGLEADSVVECREQAGKPAKRRKLDNGDAKKKVEDKDPEDEEDEAESFKKVNGLDLKKIREDIKPTLQNTIYLVHYSLGNPVIDGNSRTKLHQEVMLATAATDGDVFLRRFTTEVIKWYKEKEHRETNGKGFSLYRYVTSSFDGFWEYEGVKRARPPASVVLPEGQMEQILLDVTKFLESTTRKWYLDHGLPHRRSYLFYGPPGTGKTSTIRSVASKFNLNCCFLSMTNSQFSNQTLANAVRDLPSNALLVLEDIDALFNVDRKNDQNVNLTFSGFLNVLDGVISADRVITVMTTNFVNRLDSALIRGGRVDRQFHFPLPSVRELEKLFMNFYPKADLALAKVFATNARQHVGKEGKSISSLQQLFINHREDSAEVCANSVETFFKDYFAVRNSDTDAIYT